MKVFSVSSDGFLSVIPAYEGNGTPSQLLTITHIECFTYDLGGNPLDWHNPENVPHDIHRTLLATNKLVRVLGDKSFGGFVEELGNSGNLLRGLRQCLEHLPLFPLSPFGCISGKEEPWTMNDVVDPG